MKTLLPEGWPRPSGYSNGILAEGRMIFVAGQIGWNSHGVFEHKDLVGQFRAAMENTIAILKAGGGAPGDVVRMTWYITDRDDYIAHLKDIGQIWRELMGKNYPAMACVVVAALIEGDAKIEIETTAVLENGDVSS
ncbi:MAG: enamine deaminase RidA [Kordiimonadales bacterium]|nr:MAG: enamine deaminase RidA [Kordiimonadales bacterium]